MAASIHGGLAHRLTILLCLFVGFRYWPISKGPSERGLRIAAVRVASLPVAIDHFPPSTYCLVTTGFELDRVANIGGVDGCWFVAVSIIDGDGNAQALVGRHSFRSERRAGVASAETEERIVIL